MKELPAVSLNDLVFAKHDFSVKVKWNEYANNWEIDSSELDKWTPNFNSVCFPQESDSHKPILGSAQLTQNQPLVAN